MPWVAHSPPFTSDGQGPQRVSAGALPVLRWCASVVGAESGTHHNLCQIVPFCATAVDFAVANLTTFNVSVFRNNGDGTFGDEVIYPLELPHSVAFGDLDGDGDLDLIIVNKSIRISLNDGDGNFGEPTSYPSCSGAFFVTTGDLDGDGDLDIVLTDTSNTVGFLANNGDATFAAVELFRVGRLAAGVAVGDLNGDGALDLAAPNFESDSVSVLLNRCADIPADLNGDGVVGAGDLIILLGNWGRCADCGDCPADLDGDCTVGATDLIILLGDWG